MEYSEALTKALDEAEATDDKTRLSLDEPAIQQEGNTTIISNMGNLAGELNRSVDRLTRFLQEEAGTMAEVDAGDRVRLTGQFRQSRVQSWIDSYVEQYVLCDGCGLPDTVIEEREAGEVLRCTACGDERTLE